MTSSVRLTIEFEFDGGPPSNEKGELEFFLNESSWCIGNVLEQLKKINDGCLCGVAKFEVLDKL